MLRSYQIELAEKGCKILKDLGIVYYAFQMRVGKTLTALQTAENYGAKSVLFVTTKKARNSILNDFSSAGYKFTLEVLNYESLHKACGKYDLIIADEAHGFGAYPKPSLRTKRLKEIVGFKPLILLSGTPSPESYSQIYHQFWLSMRSPFIDGNFYKWAKSGFVFVQQVLRQGVRMNDYSRANKELIERAIKPYMLTYTQDQAGFEQKEIIEKIVEITAAKEMPVLMNYLLKNQLYKFKSCDDMIIADTAVKLLQKLHQLSSGTIITENKEYMVLDCSKANYIRDNYAGQKIAVFYKFIAERRAIESAIGKRFITESPEEFNNSHDLVFVSQIKSGALGINLETADILIFYNIDFSSQLYWQARERIQSMKRNKPAIVHWLFSRGGIESKIYKKVLEKKDFTTHYFRKEYGL